MTETELRRKVFEDDARVRHWQAAIAAHGDAEAKRLQSMAEMGKAVKQAVAVAQTGK